MIAVGSALRKVVLIIGTFFHNETRYFRAGGKRSRQRSWRGIAVFRREPPPPGPPGGGEIADRQIQAVEGAHVRIEPPGHVARAVIRRVPVGPCGATPMRPRRQVNAIRLDGVPECPFEPFVTLCAPVLVPTRRLPLSPCDEGGGRPSRRRCDNGRCRRRRLLKI